MLFRRGTLSATTQECGENAEIKRPQNEPGPCYK